jgi:hypothetical protein
MVYSTSNGPLGMRSLTELFSLDENLPLFEQIMSERNTRKSFKATAVGGAKVRSYEDIVEAQKQGNIKEAGAGCARARLRSTEAEIATQVLGKRYAVRN